MNFIRMARATAISIIACCLFSPARSQDSPPASKQPLSVEFKAHYGFFITNKPKAVYLRDSYSSFGEISVSKQTCGTAYWQQANNYPRIGLAAFYGNTGGRRYLGHMSGVFPFVNFTLHRSTGFRLGFRLGTGLAWIEKPYDVNTNFKNLMIGTHLNSCISMLVESEARLGRHWALNGGISFTHMSNGLWEVPNLGLNIPALSLGLRYQLTETPHYRKTTAPLTDKKMHWQVFVMGAIKQGEWLESPHAFVTTLTTELMFHKKNNDEWGGGLLLTDDPSLAREIPLAPILTLKDSLPKIQAGLYACYEHNIGRVSIPLQLGAYVYNKYPVNALFEVIGIRYRVSRHITAALQLKTHMGKADHIDWGFGYRF